MSGISNISLFNLLKIIFIFFILKGEYYNKLLIIKKIKI